MEKLTKELLEQWSEEYNGSAERQLATMALSKTNLNDVSYVASAAFDMKQKFSVEIKTMDVTDQMHSGRCWLFAATNILREKIAKALGLEKFELSQSYLAFWDKFERCNYFLENIIDTADRPADDRTVSFILTSGVHDGGQWDMFVNIVEKYGLVPKDVFGETGQSCDTSGMNGIVNRNLKACAVKLRNMIKEGSSSEEVKEEKNRMLQKLYAFLCSCYTEPPKTFDFEYVDKNGIYHAEREMTPKAFYEKYVGDYLCKMISIINAPTEDKPFYRTFTVDRLGNVAEAKGVKYLNLPMPEFKGAVVRQLQAGKVVWFGSDVGKGGDRKNGIWDDNSFNAELLTGLDLEINKGDGLDYRFSAMGHAMVITGVNIKDGKPTRWKIENSWGDKNGAKGYYVCSDSWFDAYVYQAAIEKEYLGETADLFEEEPIVLKPWDPMGTLAL
ncbi:MAG: C1 family peptidase [Firmicutes bacterium]|nr:C1 family peptidase [Bacillota bacterium]